jgi:hypothetical protein
VAASDRFPVATVAIERAVRLVSTARLRDPVLLALVDASLLNDLAEIEGATSFRLAEQSHAANLFPSGRPHANFVNAAFAYFRPRERHRFNGPDRGAWYARSPGIPRAGLAGERARKRGGGAQNQNDTRNPQESGYMPRWRPKPHCPKLPSICGENSCG